MNENELLIKNRLREATVILERANLIICDESWKCDSSRPPFSSFQLVMQGEGTVQVDQTVLHPHAGQLYLLPACTHQSFFTDVQNPYRTYFCHFEITCQQTDLFQLVQFPLCVDAKDPQKAQRIFQDIIQSCKQTDISSALKAKQAVFHLLCYYFECCPPGSVSFIPQSFDSPLSSAISYVETHLHEQITVQQMAEVAGYHSSYFTKLFQTHMGISPGQFILQKKTETATLLLTSTDLPISKIADTLGFDNQFYFSNFFQKTNRNGAIFLPPFISVLLFGFLKYSSVLLCKKSLAQENLQ